jgi:hypothetical protein
LSESAFQIGPPPKRELESRSIIAKRYADTAKGNEDSMGRKSAREGDGAIALAGDADA